MKRKSYRYISDLTEQQPELTEPNLGRERADGATHSERVGPANMIPNGAAVDAAVGQVGGRRYGHGGEARNK